MTKKEFEETQKRNIDIAWKLSVLDVKVLNNAKSLSGCEVEWDSLEEDRTLHGVVLGVIDDPRVPQCHVVVECDPAILIAPVSEVGKELLLVPVDDLRLRGGKGE